MQVATWCDGGCTGNTGVTIIIHDAVGGYYVLGGFSNPVANSPLSMNISSFNRGQIDDVMVRVSESAFSNLSVSGSRQRTHIWSIKVMGVTSSPTVTSSYGGTAVTHASYDYAPTIINDNGTYRMYWCGLQADGTGDAIWYANSTNAINWSTPQIVLNRTANSAETDGASDGHVCDPSVVKVGSTYYMYYTAASLSGTNNKIFRATSSNGTTWTKYPSNSNPQPVIKNPTTSSQYSVGQQTVIYLNGKFYAYYTHTDRGGEIVSISYNGITWFPQNGNNPVFPAPHATNWVVTYLWRYNIFMAVQALNEATNAGINYTFSYDGITWNQPISNIPAGGSRTAVHNIGILTDRYGLVSGQSTKVYYGAGTPNGSTWDIDITNINLQP